MSGVGDRARDAVERSSLGTPEAKALRATVTDEHAARVLDLAGRHVRGAGGCRDLPATGASFRYCWCPLDGASDASDRARDAAGLSEAAIAAIYERYQRACGELDRITAGHPGETWRWSIPANPDRGSDLLLSASVEDVPVLLAVVECIKADAMAQAWDEGERAGRGGAPGHSIVPNPYRAEVAP